MEAKKRRPSEAEDEKSPPTKVAKVAADGIDAEKRVIVVLENAALETVKVGGKFELLNDCDHEAHLKKQERESTSAQPCIVHQCLKTLLDSPLNRAGCLQVFVHTARNVLIEVNPQTRIPRTFKRFSGLMVQLLQKLSIKAPDGSGELLKVIKNSVADQLPADCEKILLSYHADVCLHPYHLIPTDKPVVFIIGAMQKSKATAKYATCERAISEYPLRSSMACAKVCFGAEYKWGIH